MFELDLKFFAPGAFDNRRARVEGGVEKDERRRRGLLRVVFVVV